MYVLMFSDTPEPAYIFELFGTVAILIAHNAFETQQDDFSIHQTSLTSDIPALNTPECEPM